MRFRNKDERALKTADQMAEALDVLLCVALLVIAPLHRTICFVLDVWEDWKSIASDMRDHYRRMDGAPVTEKGKYEDYPRTTAGNDRANRSG